jgi:hypothetical protein
MAEDAAIRSGYRQVIGLLLKLDTSPSFANFSAQHMEIRIPEGLGKVSADYQTGDSRDNSRNTDSMSLLNMSEPTIRCLWMQI